MSKHAAFLSSIQNIFHKAFQLPQYPRFISALIKNRYVSAVSQIFLWTILGVFIYTNVKISYPMTFPQVLSSALTFFHIASPQNTAVLGLSDTSSIEPSTLDEIKEHYAYWQTVVQDHPDFRDGFYMAALLAYQLGNTSDARIYLNKVKAIDPNYPETTRLEKLLERN